VIQSLESFLSSLKARGISENTQKAYRSDLADFLEFLSDSKQSLNLDSLRDWMWRQSEAGASKSTLARKTSSVKAFTEFLFEQGEITTTMKGHTGSVNYVSYHPNGQVIASCSTD
jgi:integrase/recombinase XerC